MTEHDHADVGPCRMQRIENRDIHLFDKGTGPPIILVHGGQTWGFTWRYQISMFAEAGYRVIAPDFPGCGYSDVSIENGSIDNRTHFLRKLLDTLGIDKVSFVAHSFGGLPVLDFAMCWPDRVDSIVLSSTCGVPHKVPFQWRIIQAPGIGEAAYIFINRYTIKSGFKSMVFDKTFPTKEVVDENLKPLRRPGAWAAQLKIERESDPSYIEKNIESINMPTILIWGENDPVHPLKMVTEFKHRLKNAEVALIPRCGHIPQEEHPELFNTLTLDFFNKHRLPTA